MAFDGKCTVKFSGIEELVEKFPPPAKVFVESSAPYVFLCKLADVYDVYCINTQLTKRFRLANGLKKTDENDANILLNIARQHLSGQLSEGVWRFQPDPLRRAVREVKRLFRCYQKLRYLDPTTAEEYRAMYEQKKKEILTAVKNDIGKIVQVLGFCEKSYAAAIIIAEAKRFTSVRKLIEHSGFTERSRRLGHYNRLLKKSAHALAYAAITKKIQPWYSAYREIRAKLPHYKAKNRLATKILKETFKAIRAG